MPLSQDAQDTIDKILGACDAARAKSDAQRNDLGERRNGLANPRPPRDLTAAEEAQLSKLDDAINALDDGDAQLSVITLEALNDSAGVSALADSMKAVNSGLKDKLQKVQKTAQQLQDLAKFLQQVDGIVQNLTKLAALLA
jgi:uncharacterized phage infection (PIP) family protein YhgE